MRRLIDRCAGIDVGQALLVVCVRVVDGSRLVEEVRSFGATTPDLLALRDWLVGLGVTQVAMESTGVYWKAPYYMLEDEFEVLLVNAAHLKHVPGRKTDVIDAQWIAEVLSYGLLRPSFVPPRPFRELRDLTRYRTSLIRARTGEVNRLHKVLEDAGVKLATVATDVMGVSGREMMHALIGGVADLADVLTECAWAAVKTKGTYLSAYYRQIMRRQGKQKAIVAVTHKIVVIVWHLLSTGTLYEDPGAGVVRKTSEEQQRRRAIRQLEALGLTVTVQTRKETDAA